MGIPTGLTGRKLAIWSMRRSGLSLAEIGRRLDLSRQYIHKAVKGVDQEVERSLRGVAFAAQIEVHRLDPEKGVLLGYSHETRDRAIVTFSTRYGSHIWHYFAGKCDDCELRDKCKELILGEAEERGITLSAEEKRNSPAEIAQRVFTNIMGDLGEGEK